MRRYLGRTMVVVVAAFTAGLAAGVLAPASASSGQAAPTKAASGVSNSSATVPAFHTASVQVFATHIAALATIGGVKLSGGAYGSALTRVPGTSNEFYGLTDRGPNVDGPGGTKVEPLPDFVPAIGKFRLSHGQATLLKRIPLQAKDGTPYSGKVNTLADTGETITDLAGSVLPKDPNGYDPEGLVALKDGTFWISDEYGPFITHFSAKGRAIERLSPYDGTLPVELKYRVPNKGMEGLTVTPDGKTLVGIMQSALQTPDLGTVKPAKVTPLRIVTVNIKTRATHEYLYLLDNPDDNSGAVSEIAALSSTSFLVDERDGNVEPGAYKKLWKIDLTGATDVGPAATVPGATYDAVAGGLLVDGKSIDAFVGADDTATALAALQAKGIQPVSKALDLDLGALVSGLDPSGGFFGHDKVEGVTTLDGGRTIVLSNDSDFGIIGLTGTTPPFTLTPKILPNGQQDDGEFLVIKR